MIGNKGSTRRVPGEAAGRPGRVRQRLTPPGRHRLRPEVLDLEGRLLLSTFTVTDPSDSLTNGLATVNTLRWAVGQANAATTPSTIAFNLGASTTTITLTQGELDLTNLADPVTIDGPGAGLLAISGNNNSRIFQLEKGVEASISGLALEDGKMSLGGAVYNAGTLSLNGCLLLNNTGPPIYYQSYGVFEIGPGEGGAIFNNNGTLSMVGCTLTGNSANEGGAIAGQTYQGVSDITLTDCTFTNNVADEYNGPFGSQDPSGGAIYNQSFSGLTILSLKDCSLTGNAVVGGSRSFGGAIANYNSTTGLATSDVTLTGCTVANNTSSSQTGGLGLSGDATLTDCTITGNTGALGAGVQVYGDSKLDLVACTISGNVSTDGNGGGLNVYSTTSYDYSTGMNATHTPQVTLTSTIIAGNTSTGGQPDDLSGNDPYTLSGSHNLIGVGAAVGLSTSDNLLGVTNPGLAPLGDYGGPTETMPLEPTSPAIGAGVAVPGLTTDQRGFSILAKPDIGAFQSEPGPMVVNTTIDGIGSPRGDLSLRQAVNLANVLDGGATITFASTTFTSPSSTITLTQGQLELSNATGPIKFEGPGASRLSVSGNKASRVLQVDSGSTVSISGLTITGGLNNGMGAGLLNQGTLALSDDTFSLNGSDIPGPGFGEGGGLYNIGTVDIVGCTFANDAAIYGGGVFNGGTATLQDCVFAGDSGYLYGGGMANYGNATLVGCSFTGDKSNSGGGFSGNDLSSSHSTRLIDCSFTGNDSSGGGGALFFTGVGSNGRVGGLQDATACVFLDNKASAGGAIMLEYTNATFTGCLIDKNTAIYGRGGGVNTLYGDVKLIDTTITGNAAVESSPYYTHFGASGGGIFIDGDGSLIDCTISGNSSEYNGGGVLAEYGKVSITDSTIRDNQALYGGGILEMGGLLTLTGSSITRNTAVYTYNYSLSGQGGGLFVGFGGTANVTDSTVADNVANFEGGGIFNQGPANLSLVGCTISGNSAQIFGGGIYNYLYGAHAHATLSNTIVAGNTTPAGPSDIAGSDAGLVTGSFNLVGTGGSGGLSPSSNLLGVANPGLAPLGNYGGPTESMPLLPGSPAIDAGNNALNVDPGGNPLTNDQRGLPRVVNGTVDIGAFETSGFVITPIPASEFAPVGTAFARPLTIKVTPIHAGDPVGGGVVSFAAPTSGPSATLSATTVILNAAGVASVTATANMQVGRYVVVTAASGARVSSPYGVAGFDLQNAQAYPTSFLVNWGDHGSSQIYLQADGLRDLPAGRSTDMPWAGIKSFTFTFSFPFTLLASQVSVTGITVANYGPVTVTVSGATYTITLAQPINAADRVTLVINNPELEPYTRELDVLPGDLNDDGVVNAQDIALDRDLYLGIPIPNPPAMIFGDILGEGTVTLADYNAVRSKSGTKLPPAK